MEEMSVRKMSIFLAVMGTLFVVCAAAVAWTERGTGGSIQGDGGETAGFFAVLTDSGFYDKDIEVGVAAPKGVQVYYSFDCEEPGPETGQAYTEPIPLYAGEEEQVYVLRFRAYYEDGTESETVTRTYFCGFGIADRYDMPVLSIVGDPAGLFGYDRGILVPGAKYDAYMEEHPGVHPGSGLEANYTMRGREWEREVVLELFDQDGVKFLSQQGGVRVAGGASRLHNHKSLRLYARREYDEQNKFSGNFFGTLYSLKDGTLGRNHKRLLLRNSGQDYGYGFLRNELVNRLANEAGFADTQHVRPVCVYVNGLYYGSYWLCSNYDEQYFENRYGEYGGSFVVLEGSDRKKLPSDETDAEELRQAEEFNAQYEAFAKMDLTQEENYQKLQDFLDVENYLQYFAIENYVGNDDWPGGNVKTYRYEAGEQGYSESGAFDGRYRMLLYDVDYGFGLMFYHDTIGCLVNEMTLDKLLNGESPLFAALMQREDCRRFFASYTLDLMNGVMRADYVAEQTDALHASHKKEIARMLDTEGLVGGALLEDEPLNMETVEKNIGQIKSFAAERPQYVLQDIGEKFGYTQRYKLTVMSENAAYPVKINGKYYAEEAFTGVYLKEIPVTLKPCPGPGEEFDHWLVNGVPCEDEELVLAGEDITGDAVEVALVMRAPSEPKLQIGAVAARGHEDYVELVNLSGQTVSTRGYYLSDGDDPYQYALPVLTLKSGETMVLVGEDNHSAESLGQFSFGFNLKEGETLTLTCSEEQVDSVVIPKMSEDGVYVRDFRRGVYVEQKREQIKE